MDEAVRKKCVGMLGKLVNDHWPDIERAQKKADSQLTVSLSLKFSNESDTLDIGATLRLVAERVKDSIHGKFNTKQPGLFKEVKEEEEKNG